MVVFQRDLAVVHQQDLGVVCRLALEEDYILVLTVVYQRVQHRTIATFYLGLFSSVNRGNWDIITTQTS